MCRTRTRLLRSEPSWAGSSPLTRSAVAIVTTTTTPTTQSTGVTSQVSLGGARSSRLSIQVTGARQISVYLTESAWRHFEEQGHDREFEKMWEADGGQGRSGFFTLRSFVEHVVGMVLAGSKPEYNYEHRSYEYKHQVDTFEDEGLWRTQTGSFYVVVGARPSFSSATGDEEFEITTIHIKTDQ